MTPLEKLSKFLTETIQQENHKSVETLAGYIVGELLGDYEDVYDELIESNAGVARISDLASDLEWSNGSPEQLDAMWRELKALADDLL